MPETIETADGIKSILYRIESIETTQHLLLRERRPQLLTELLDLFRATDKLADVYFAVDSKRSQNEIVEFLNSSGVKVSQPTVSRRMATLEEEGLIEKVGSSRNGGIVYAKKEVVEKVLRLAHKLHEQQASENRDNSN